MVVQVVGKDGNLSNTWCGYLREGERYKRKHAKWGYLTSCTADHFAEVYEIVCTQYGNAVAIGKLMHLRDTNLCESHHNTVVATLPQAKRTQSSQRGVYTTAVYNATTCTNDGW